MSNRKNGVMLGGRMAETPSVMPGGFGAAAYYASVQSNIKKLIAAGASSEGINRYLISSGVSPDKLWAFFNTTARPGAKPGFARPSGAWPSADSRSGSADDRYQPPKASPGTVSPRQTAISRGKYNAKPPSTSAGPHDFDTHPRGRLPQPTIEAPSPGPAVEGMTLRDLGFENASAYVGPRLVDLPTLKNSGKSSGSGAAMARRDLVAYDPMTGEFYDLRDEVGANLFAGAGVPPNASRSADISQDGRYGGLRSCRRPREADASTWQYAGDD